MFEWFFALLRDRIACIEFLVLLWLTVPTVRAFP